MKIYSNPWKQLLTLILILSATPSFAGLLCEATTQNLLGPVGVPLRETLGTLERALEQANAQIQNQQAAIQATTGTLAAQRKSQDDHWASMNFRERYLGGAFWGRKPVVADYEQKASDVAHTEADLGKQQATLNKFEREKTTVHDQISAAIAEWLAKNDQSFAQLRTLEAQLNEARCEGASCLTEIDEAMDAVNSAQAYETWDAFSKSKAASFASYAGVHAAKSELGDVRGAVRKLNKKLEALNTSVQTLREAHVSDTLDLAFDFLFDSGFDFTSWTTLSRLADAENSLEGLQTRVREIQNKIKADLVALRQKIENILCETRGLCAQPPTH